MAERRKDSVAAARRKSNGTVRANGTRPNGTRSAAPGTEPGRDAVFLGASVTTVFAVLAADRRGSQPQEPLKLRINGLVREEWAQTYQALYRRFVEFVDQVAEAAAQAPAPGGMLGGALEGAQPSGSPAGPAHSPAPIAQHVETLIEAQFALCSRDGRESRLLRPVTATAASLSAEAWSDLYELMVSRFEELEQELARETAATIGKLPPDPAPAAARRTAAKVTAKTAPAAGAAVGPGTGAEGVAVGEATGEPLAVPAPLVRPV